MYHKLLRIEFENILHSITSKVYNYFYINSKLIENNKGSTANTVVQKV